MRVADAIARCLAGDTAAYRVVVAAHADQLVAVLSAFLGNVEDGRDVAQETFVRAFRHLHTYDSTRPFRPWLFRIGRNLAKNHARARLAAAGGRAAASEENALARLPSETKSPLALVLEDERRAAVERVLGRMRPQYREVLVLRYMSRLDYEQIATAFDVPVGTVKTWLNRAKASFRLLAEREEVL